MFLCLEKGGRISMQIKQEKRKVMNILKEKLEKNFDFEQITRQYYHSNY